MVNDGRSIELELHRKTSLSEDIAGVLSTDSSLNEVICEVSLCFLVEEIDYSCVLTDGGGFPDAGLAEFLGQIGASPDNCSLLVEVNLTFFGNVVDKLGLCTAVGSRNLCVDLLVSVIADLINGLLLSRFVAIDEIIKTC